jgi:hypothetical protein
MSAVQAGGGKGSGQRPPGGPGGRAPTKPKPSANRGAGGQPKGAGQRPATKPGSDGRGGGGPGGRGRRTGYRPAAGPPRRFNPTTIAFAAVAVVVVIIVALVIVATTGGNSNKNSSTVQGAVDTTAQASVVNAVTGVPPSVADAVGVPSTSDVNPPTVKPGQSKLTIGGKPAAVFIGAEFCPYCAAERWAIIVAFSRFGTFSGLKETTSSPWDTYPSTPTFSFHGATYSSSYLTFATSEHDSNDTSGLGTRSTLEPLTSLESTLWARYDGGAANEGFPFLDIGNKYLVTAPSYSPQVLSGLDQQDVASKLTNPKDPVTIGIVGTANYLTAALCDVTGQQPSSVCSASYVSKAAKAMGTG